MQAQNLFLKVHYILMRALGWKIDSKVYWEWRYRKGDDSGEHSAGRLAEYKADFINEFVAEKHIRTVLELGCGDGKQLSLVKSPYNLGADIFETAIELCEAQSASDRKKISSWWFQLKTLKRIDWS